MEKKPFLTLQQVQEITKTYPTPFHIYDEKAIRENARKVKRKHLRGIRATRNTSLLRRRRTRVSSRFCMRKALAVTAPVCPSCSSAMFAA